MQSTGKLKFSETEEHHFSAEDLVDCGEIGRGNFGAVNKMRFRKAGRIMAVKRIRFGTNIIQQLLSMPRPGQSKNIFNFSLIGQRWMKRNRSSY